MPDELHPSVIPKNRRRQWWVDLAVLGFAIVVSALSLTYLTALMDNTISTFGNGMVVACGMALVIAPLYGWMLDRKRATARLRAPRTTHHAPRALGSPAIVRSAMVLRDECALWS